MGHSTASAYALYIASALGAVALFMAMPGRTRTVASLGWLLGSMTLGGLWIYFSRILIDLTLPGGATPYYYIFSAIAVTAAVKVITNTKPVFAALWFILVILASSGLLLTLSVSFVAFAMIIIYGGAIIVTYMFVIMLAGQSGDPTGHDQLPHYERVAREPVAAITAGFLLLAVLLSITFMPMQPNPDAAAPSDQQLIATHLQNRATDRMIDQISEEHLAPVLASKHNLANIERVGMNLFQQNPLGLELAGIILLVALVGAVVIVRTRISDENKPQETDASSS